jgi:hypothetical protein
MANAALYAQTTEKLEQLLTVREVAAILRHSAGWVYAHKAEIGYVAVGGIRFEPSTVALYIQRVRCRASAPASTVAPTAPSSGRSTRRPVEPTPSDSPQVAEIMRRLARGSRPASSSACAKAPNSPEGA